MKTIAKRTPLLFIVPFFLLVSSFDKNYQQKKNNETRKDSSVYICYSVSVEAYHSTANCKDLSRSKEIIKVNLTDALKKYHRKACRFCVNDK